jgi:hypothetical protein
MELVFTPTITGDYRILITNLRNTSGDYRLRIRQSPANEARIDSRVELSGPALSYDTPRFRIHYTLGGVDAVTEDYVHQVGDAMEEIYTAQIDTLAWAPPFKDGQIGGNDHYDVYLLDLINDAYDYGLGVAVPSFPFGDNPDTSFVEKYGGAGFIRLDNDYAEEAERYGYDPITLMRTTAAHEFHHIIQFSYDVFDTYNWYYEATASWMEIITFPDDEDASRYIEDVYAYPEICLGADDFADPTGGSLKYGTWLFLESLAETHGDAFMNRLWENIALDDGWVPLEETLKLYNDALPDAVVRYHLRNLVRDYKVAPRFDKYVVWLENDITDTGRWSFSGRGIQELAANYYTVELAEGAYSISLQSDNENLELWLVGVKGLDAAVTPLGRGATVNIGGYSNTHLMVFNHEYDNDITECQYSDYTIAIQAGRGTPALPAFLLDASHFAPIN